jgi:hypothetical protein
MTGRLEISAPTGDKDQFAGERSAVFVPSLTFDYRRGSWFGAAELGARIRPTTELAGARVGSQIAVGLGVGVDILKRELLSAVLEARALPTLAEQATTSATTSGLVSHGNDELLIPAEWTLSARTSPLLGGDLGLQLGGGGAIPLAGDVSVTTPRFRFTLSIRYAPVVKDTDGDGLLDADDRCPREVGPRPTGCPPAPAEAPTAPAGQEFDKPTAGSLAPALPPAKTP